MNWEIFREIIEDYKSKGQFKEALDFMKEWNVVGQDVELEVSVTDKLQNQGLIE